MQEKTHFEVGQFLFLNEKYDQAIIEFNKSLEKDPGNAEALYSLGIVYEAKNMLKQAKEYFRTALELDPKHKLAEEHLSKLTGV